MQQQHPRGRSFAPVNQPAAGHGIASSSSAKQRVAFFVIVFIVLVTTLVFLLHTVFGVQQQPDNRPPPPLNTKQDLFVSADKKKPASTEDETKKKQQEQHEDDDHQHHHHHGAFRNNNPESVRAVLVRAVVSPETDPILKDLNVPYHELRRRIRSRGPKHAHRVHTFFTMDCTDHSAWQAGTLENSWEKVGQEGVLTRVISGCEAWVKETDPKLQEKVERTKRHFLSSDEVARERRGSFYAPYSSTLPSGRHYAPYNRPHSVYYWLKHADLTEEVFVMLDPDMVFLNVLPTEAVRLGAPVSQIYDYMENTPFEDMHCPSCPNKKWDRRPYAVGPPWMMHLSDWIRVTPRWMAITGELAEKYPTNWIVEMIAYSVACKVENLPHSTTYRAMVDNVDDAIVWNENTDELGLDGGGAGGNNRDAIGVNKHNPKLVYPSTLHYCYTLELGEMNPPEGDKHAQHVRFSHADATDPHPVLGWYHFSKYRVPTDWPGGKATYGKNFMECGTPLLQEFKSLGNVMHSVFGDSPNPMMAGQQVHDKKPVPARFRGVWRRAATMLELLLPAVNSAMTAYKERYCPPENRNLKKLLRTTHPGFFVSRWELGEQLDERGLNVSYHLA